MILVLERGEGAGVDSSTPTREDENLSEAILRGGRWKEECRMK